MKQITRRHPQHIYTPHPLSQKHYHHGDWVGEGICRQSALPYFDWQQLLVFISTSLPRYFARALLSISLYACNVGEALF